MREDLGLTPGLVFASGTMPTACRNGHPWTGRRAYWLRWSPCDCPAALAVAKGHHVVSCRAEGCTSVWRDPPCDLSAGVS